MSHCFYILYYCNSNQQGQLKEKHPKTNLLKLTKALDKKQTSYQIKTNKKKKNQAESNLDVIQGQTFS